MPLAFGSYASLSGLLSARPAADPLQIGRFYLATDTGLMYRDNGTAWKSCAPVVAYPFSNPLDYTWQWNNQVGAIAVDATDHITILGDATGGTTTYGMRARETAMSTAGDFEVIGAVRGFGTANTNVGFGIYARSDSIVYAAFCLLNSSATMRTDSRTAPNAATTSILYATNVIGFRDTMWFKIARVGTALATSFSIDGACWVQMYSTTDSSAFTFAGFFSELRFTSGTTLVECDSFSANF